MLGQKKQKKQTEDTAHALRRASALERERGSCIASFHALDRHLPGGGVEAGSLVEVLGEPGSGALRLGLRLAAGLQARARQRTAVLVDPLDPGSGAALYPPALVQAGLDLGRLVVLRPRPDDLLACLDEVLRSSAVSVAVARLSVLASSSSHRLRHAATQGGGVGVLVRPASARAEVSGAPLRLLVREGGAPGRPLVLEPLRARGLSLPADPWNVDVDAWSRSA
jgi:hypothetical protein